MLCRYQISWIKITGYDIIKMLYYHFSKNTGQGLPGISPDWQPEKKEYVTDEK